MSDIIRVLRVIEYTGPRELVEAQIANSIHGERRIGKYKDHGTHQSLDGEVVIRAATIGNYPEILNVEECHKLPGET